MNCPTVAAVVPESIYASRALDSKNLNLSFHQAFGYLGIVMLFVALACALWTSWLFILTIAPNATANYLMNTAEFDNGTFWLIIDPEPVMMVFSGAGLGLIFLGYLFVLLQMTVFRNCKHKSERSDSWTRDRSSSFPVFSSRWFLRTATYWSEMTSFHGRYRKYWNFKLKMIDLVLQSITLYQYLERGCPEVLTYGYAALVAGNAFVYAVCILTSSSHSAFAEVIIDSIFDLLITIVFPINVLAYCYNNFQLERDVLLLNMSVYPPGSFEASARLSSDATQTALFRLMFDSLRIQSMLDFMLRISMNLSLCYRFKRVADIVGQSRRCVLAQQDLRPASDSQVIVAQHSLPRTSAIGLLAFVLLLTLITQMAIQTSRVRCMPYSECVAYAYRLSISHSANPFCPCIALVNADRAPKTYDEWINPENVTDRVRLLAASGDLRVLQIINRNMVEWPIELQRCANLLHITLIYAGTATLPTWANTFHKLEYIHIEGTKEKGGLQLLPDDLFAGMSHLTFLHLGLHPMLQALPSFHGLVNLKVLYLAGLLSLRDLPAVTSLGQLERLEIMGLPRLAVLPELAPLTKLVQLAIAFGSSICCNGFLDTPCDLSNPLCSVIPTATCLNSSAPHASQSTLAVLERFSSTVCQYAEPTGIDLITQSSVDICDGVAFKQCPEDSAGIPGICVSVRLQVIRCVHDPNTVTMRRQQILLGVGPPCNATAEAWLGCAG